ncbi:MAG: hypothetical protein Q4G51_05865 [Dermatophilus congolensis]|nr:hypothetical protein [Dermatophilus congolensis]
MTSNTATPTTVSDSPSPTWAVTEAPTPSETPSSEATATTDVTSEPSTRVVTPTVSTGEQRLTLADAFAVADWNEGEFTPAGKPQAVQAMQVKVNCSDDAEYHRLEFRFAQPTGTLQVDVAQDMASTSSRERLQFVLRTDERQADAKTIPFKGAATLSTPLDGVTVAVVEVSPQQHTVDYRCNGTSSALITRMAVVR